jgi:hypothetical protein
VHRGLRKRILKNPTSKDTIRTIDVDGYASIGGRKHSLDQDTVVEVYVDAKTIAGLGAVAAEAALRPIAGGRLTLRPFPTLAARRLASEIGGLHVAPWPRVYADLRAFGVRGEEAAEHLRDVIRGR